ncbi:hypothetical protein J132_03104 [Termitomyces sp. J132]|nr:hypothetical protein J132_03104 [Termitomyces sp. J132]
MSHCPHCCTACTEEAHKEQRAKAHEHAAVHACHAKHLFYADLDFLNPPPLAFPHREALYEDVQGAGCESLEKEGGDREWTSTPDAESLDKTIEVGDRIYATILCPPATVAEIWASQTTSQYLAKAFAANSQPKPSYSTILNHLSDFENVFSKASFDSLPECKQWDHAIELIPDAEPFSCKVYPLAPHEQDELDAFLQENPSKSPMASPVFFIRKKDGSLCLVQDYHVLNAMTVKNCYPLQLIL